MRILLISIFILSSIGGFSKNPNPEKVLELGKDMYKIEKASWHSTDHFLENYSQMRDSISGYLSYIGNDKYVYSIFFSKKNNNRILARYKFNANLDKQPVSIDIDNHKATDNEKILIAIRQDAINRFYENSDTFFKFYENTSYNFIPIISNKKKTVFVITAPTKHGNVIIGNDYKLTYKKNNEFGKKEKLHNSIIYLPYKNSKSQITTTMHSHVISDIIDPTDICTLLLYREFVEWKQHVVISKKYVSIFDMAKERIVVMDKEDYFKMHIK